MLTRLRIRNFKAWQDTKDIRLAPITVFFGSNSSGKSSLLQFLLMLRQTAESPDRRRVLHPGDKNTLVELGTYRDLVFNHNLTQEISFDLEWALPANLFIRDPLSRDRFWGRALAFAARVASDEDGSHQHVQSLRYELKNGRRPLHVEMTSREEREPKRKYSLAAAPYTLRRSRGRAWSLPPPVRFYGFPEEVGAYYQNAGFTSRLALALEQQLKRVQYLGPLRIHPERSYIWSGEVPEHVGWRGERAVEAMLAAGNRSISAGYKKRAHPFHAVIAQWLKEMGLLETFQVQAVAAHRKEYEVVVKSPGADQPVNLPDVGFGISQVLPVVVQCFYAAPHATVLLEQPEIHLHPRVQTALADLFIAAVQSREGGSPRAVQLVIESHSEHFLRRLQRKVAERAIEPKNVALYFCETTAHGAELRPLDMSVYGDIKNWPQDFFGNEIGEIAARMDAAARRASSAR